MSEVSVIIPLYQGASTIAEQLDALETQTLPGCEIIVADNGSTDDGPLIVRRHAAGARLVDASGQRGQGYARNVGAEAARGSKLLFCDQDDIVDPQWASALSKSLEFWDVVGGLLEERTLNLGIEAWRRPATSIFSARPLPYGAGANLGIRRAVFEAIGGWPTDVLGSAEDNYLCWAAQLEGYSFAHDPAAVVHYRWKRKLRTHVLQQYVYGRNLPIVQSRFPQFEPAQITPSWKTLGWLVANAPLMLHKRSVGLWLGTAAFRVGMGRGVRLIRERRIK